MKQTKLTKKWYHYLRRFAYRVKILRVLQGISREKYDEKISASLVYGFLSAVAVNFSSNQGTFIQVVQQVWLRLFLHLAVTGLDFTSQFQ